jgi:hypothetical protein
MSIFSTAPRIVPDPPTTDGSTCTYSSFPSKGTPFLHKSPRLEQLLALDKTHTVVGKAKARVTKEAAEAAMELSLSRPSSRRFRLMLASQKWSDRSTYLPSDATGELVSLPLSTASIYVPSPRVPGKAEVGTFVPSRPSTRGTFPLTARPDFVIRSGDEEGSARFNPREVEDKRRESQRGKLSAVFKPPERLVDRMAALLPTLPTAAAPHSYDTMDLWDITKKCFHRNVRPPKPPRKGILHPDEEIR